MTPSHPPDPSVLPGPGLSTCASQAESRVRCQMARGVVPTFLAASPRTRQAGGRCAAAWEAAAADPTREARQTKAPRAPAYAKVNANLRGARSHLALVYVHLSSHPPVSLPVPGAAAPRPPRSPRAAEVLQELCYTHAESH